MRSYQKISTAFFLVFNVCIASQAAEIGVLLHENPPGISMGGSMTKGGHLALWMADVCADSPILVRRCRAGEANGGMVISRNLKPGLVVNGKPLAAINGEEKLFMAIPLPNYIYGVDDLSQIPLFMTPEINEFHRNAYGNTLLKSMPELNGVIPEGDWKKTIGSGVDRDIYLYSMNATDTETDQIIDAINNHNNGAFNIFFRNCSNAVLSWVPNVFGLSLKDRVTSLGMVDPTTVTKAFVKTAQSQHRDLTATKFSQLPSTKSRSTSPLRVAENGYRNPLYVALEIGTGQIYLPLVFFGLNSIGGNFNREKVYETHFADDQLLKINQELEKKNGSIDPNRRKELEKSRQALMQSIFGSEAQWGGYHTAVKSLIQQAQQKGILPANSSIRDVAQNIVNNSKLSKGNDGSVMLSIQIEKAGISSSSTSSLSRTHLKDDGNDPYIAFVLLAANIEFNTSAERGDRPLYAQVVNDWKTLSEVSSQIGLTPPIIVEQKEAKNPIRKVMRFFRGWFGI